MTQDKQKWIEGKCCSGNPNCIHNPDKQESVGQTAKDFVFREFGHACDGNHPENEDCGTCECVGQVAELIRSERSKADALREENVYLKSQIEGRGGYKELVKGLGAYRHKIENELSTTKAENERLKQLVASGPTVNDDLRCELESVKAQLEVCMAALKTHGTHHFECKNITNYPVNCDCGLDDALKSTTQPIKGTSGFYGGSELMESNPLQVTQPLNSLRRLVEKVAEASMILQSAMPGDVHRNPAELLEEALAEVKKEFGIL